MWMMLLRRRRAIVCRRAVELVTDYLEGALSERDRVRFEAHLAECPHCSRYLEQIRDTIAAVGTVEPKELEREAREELVALYRRWRTG
jgi:anti-sigma factor RsiW